MLGGSARAIRIACSSRSPSLLLLGPHQVGQPRHRVLVAYVEGVEVRTAAPRDLGVAARDRQVAGRLGREHRSPAAGELADGRPGVVVAVGIQAQPGAGADLDQAQRSAPGDPREHRHERREPADLVGLGRALADRRLDLRLVLDQHRLSSA